MQKPNTPTAQRAITAARSAQIGLREKVATRCDTMPKHGSIATYTSACAKNQNQRCQTAKSETLEVTLAAKNCVPRNQSESSSAHAASRIPKISRLRTAVTYHAQTVRGRRINVIPSVRASVTVTQKFTEDSMAPTEKQTTLRSQRAIPECMGKKNEAETPSNDASVSQNDKPLRNGSAISFAPICRGKKKYPKPNCGAAVRTKKTISDP